MTQQPGAPGMLVLDQDLSVLSMSPQAEQWLALLSDDDADGLPMPLYAFDLLGVRSRRELIATILGHGGR